MSAKNILCCLAELEKHRFQFIKSEAGLERLEMLTFPHQPAAPQAWAGKRHPDRLQGRLPAEQRQLTFPPDLIQ